MRSLEFTAYFSEFGRLDTPHAPSVTALATSLSINSIGKDFGAGVVSHSIAAKHLSAFTPSRLAEAFL
jgi:hypothetical protein